MVITIDGEIAVLKKGTSFEYVTENREFSDADDYTMTVTFPLKDCPENIAIFGHMHRMDTWARKMKLRASISCGSFFREGVITVIEVSEVEVKCQLLFGKSLQNFGIDIDDTYINELPIASCGSIRIGQNPTVPGTIDNEVNYVCLPWVNDSADGHLNNEMLVDDKTYEVGDTPGLVWGEQAQSDGMKSCMPYLIYVAKRICDEVGYTYDFRDWELSEDRFLLVCNCLPGTWGIEEIARALPHWTVTEFFDEIEKILMCEFDIDEVSHTVTCHYSRADIAAKPVVTLDNIVDSFTDDVRSESDTLKYRPQSQYEYADRGDSDWKFDDCQWLVEYMRSKGKLKEFDSFNDMDRYVSSVAGSRVDVGKDNVRGEELGVVYYVKAVDDYYVLFVRPEIKWDGTHYNYYFRRINICSSTALDAEDKETVELKCVPARIAETDYEHGKAVFLAPSSFDESEDIDEDAIRQPMAYSMILRGESKGLAEYYDKLYLAYWQGEIEWDIYYHNGVRISRPYPPCPVVDSRFRLGSKLASIYSNITIYGTEKMKISWLADSIPDVRSVFIIRGRRYVCEKITATFSESGMSQLLKGEFWQIRH